MSIQQSSDQLSSRSEQVVKLKNLLFEGGVALEALTSKQQYLPWLARINTYEINEICIDKITQMQYAYEMLLALDEDGFSGDGSIYTLLNDFRKWLDKVQAYKKLLDTGKIQTTGKADASTEDAREALVASEAAWREKLDKVRKFIASIYWYA